MFYYVEFLRAKRALLIAGILVGLFFVTAMVARYSVGITDPIAWKQQAMASPTAHTTVSKTPDGWTKTVIDDPQQRVHATVLEQGNSVDIDATMPNSRPAHIDVVAGDNSRSIDELPGGMRHLRMRTKMEPLRVEIGVLVLITLPMGLFMATLLGGVLSKENDGHLELAWSKPVSRERYALAAFGVDIAAILAAQALCIVATLLAMLTVKAPTIYTDASTGVEIALGLLGSLSWYALLNAASASIKRGPGMVIGLGWAAALLIPGIAHTLGALAQYSAIAGAFYKFFDAVSYLDPLRYLSITFRDHVGLISGSGFSLGLNATMLGVLIVVYSVLAVAQWRRVEA